MQTEHRVKWLTRQLRIQDVPGSNLGLETGYTNWGFPWYSSVPTREFRDSTLD
jgi:hypothetical protein